MRIGIGTAAVIGGLSLLSGCGMYYSRVGGTAHDKLYRGTREEVVMAVEEALKRHCYEVQSADPDGDTVHIQGTIGPEESVSVRIRPGKEGLMDTKIGSATDWRKAIEIHRWIALELGVLYRRDP